MNRIPPIEKLAVQRDVERAAEALRMIEFLVSDDGDSVTIVSAYVDPLGPNRAIYCGGKWLRCVPERFEAATLVEALEQACIERVSRSDKGGE